MNLAPTSTGSATAIALIFPELKGKLNGLAVRVPLTNASITDAVFEVKRKTTEQEVNALLKVRCGAMPHRAALRCGAAGGAARQLSGLLDQSRVEPEGLALSPSTSCHVSLPLPLGPCPLQEASETYLQGILGYEEVPLVSTDYVNDRRSSIVDAPCTQVRGILGLARGIGGRELGSLWAWSWF